MSSKWVHKQLSLVEHLAFAVGHLDAAPVVLSAGGYGAQLIWLCTEQTWEQRDLPATLPPNVTVAAAPCTHAVNTGLPLMFIRHTIFLPTPKSVNKSVLIEEMAG